MSLEKQALAITETALGPDHPDTATRLGNLARTYSAIGRLTDALPFAERAHRYALAALGANDDNTEWLANLVAQIRDRVDSS